MKKMFIYEPAMCCSTGLCGVGVDPELLRISTVLNNLKNNGTVVTRYNLSSAPQEFVSNTEINTLLNEKGVEILPITVLDGKIVKTASYPTNDEFASLLDVPKAYLGGEIKTLKLPPKRKGGCDCDGGCC